MKGFSLIEIVISLLIAIIFVLSFFQLHRLITNLSNQNQILTECLSICSTKLETIMYNSHLLTLRKVGSNYPIYNLIDPKELNYNSAWNVYDSFKKHYLSKQIPFYFYEQYRDFGISTRVRVYSVKNFYTVTVYCYHKNHPDRKYSLTAIIKSNY
ncbi:MAG: hypothetical protein RMJ51_01735 [Candidatus Calescibacterium sp.]|nr:hypothetical protein [Candidatus Calescibacterium sp.]MCX7971834.1 hypothetical protein [bacterium]MDW8194949.1 hypothetical protein [Candidatus Calescibacterium sp.]